MAFDHPQDDRWTSAARSIYGETAVVSALGAAPRRDEHGVIFEARWVERAGEDLSAGPDMLVLYVAPDASPTVRRRGMTAGLMRHMERYLTEQMRELEQAAVADGDALVREEVEEFLAANPTSPRAGGDIYYAGLLRFWDQIESRARTEGWAPRALELVASAMGLNVETLRSRIRTARKRASVSEGER
ncbi:hypothetical protein [Microlunatus antarcticus]|uniref:Uncharacterized protein n=1 Tax=Microlunatus antarcticus TaxID=53388 RepID=A0A7W5JSL9_9ACTN|nr:hypothetical protein [Microlunatus antarcticus]MBB3325495.1 hypothetical protein [Microlunatus antarcticus]